MPSFADELICFHFVRLNSPIVVSLCTTLPVCEYVDTLVEYALEYQMPSATYVTVLERMHIYIESALKRLFNKKRNPI